MCCSSSDACSRAPRFITSFMCVCVTECGSMPSLSRRQSPGGGAGGYYHSSAVAVGDCIQVTGRLVTVARRCNRMVRTRTSSLQHQPHTSRRTRAPQ